MEFRRRRALALAAVAAVVVSVAAVVALGAWMLYDPNSGEHTGTDAHMHSDPEADPVGVAEAAMTAMYSWRPAGQEGPWDSMHATSYLFTGEMAEAAAARPEREPLPKQWFAWAEENARITAATEVGDVHIEGDSGQVTVRILQRVMHDDGDVTPLPDMNARVDVVDTDDGWKAENYELAAAN